MTSDVPRQKLCEIVARYGQSVYEDPRKCEGLLRDFCGGYRREIYALVNALRERTAEDLLSASEGVPQEVLAARLAKRLEDFRGLDKELAYWAVVSWGLALGRFSLDETEKRRKQEEKQKQAEKIKKEREQLRLRSEQEKESRLREDERKKIEAERLRLQQEAKRNEEEHRKLEEERRIRQEEESKRGEEERRRLQEARKRKQRLVGAIAVSAVLVVGGSAALWKWQEWKAAEQARIQAEQAKVKAEQDRLKFLKARMEAEAKLKQDRDRQLILQRQWEQQQRDLIEKNRRPPPNVREPQRPVWQDWGTPVEQQPRPREWERYKQSETDRLKQQGENEQRRLAEINRRRQEQEDRRRQAELDQQRRLQEAQDRAEQQKRDRVIQEGLRALERFVR